MKTNDAPTPTGDNTAGPRKSLNYRTGPVAPGAFRETIPCDTVRWAACLPWLCVC